ncbi:hypothetical protein [Frankia sp. CiP3]|uniref:hypothetical protein n=1 Tax=Frankia sp. CiP3 TaxID=2880971 RepID=UPI001EF69351|nr:hypothetical protein [Frankia sp. CiP3]
MHHILYWALGLAGSAIVLGIASLVLNAVLLIFKIGNVKTAAFDRKVAKVVGGLPRGILLVCNGKKVGMLSYDQATKSEKIFPLYTGEVTWKGGPRLATKVVRIAERRARTRFAVFGLVFLPCCVGSVVLAIVVHPAFLILLAVLVFHQFVPFSIWCYPGLELGELVHDN